MRSRCAGHALPPHLFDAALALIPSPAEDLDAHEAARQLVVEVIAICFPQAPRQACARWKERLDEVGAKGERVDSLAKRVRETQEKLHERAQVVGEGERVRDVLTDAPVSPDVMVLPGYGLTPDGIVAPFATNGEDRIDAPVLVQALHVDAATDLQYATVVWRQGGEWQPAV